MLDAVLHPMDTLVETKADAELALEHSTMLWCLGTGHVKIGGVGRAEFARSEARRRSRPPQGRPHSDGRQGPQSAGLNSPRSPAGSVQPFGAGAVAVDEVVFALGASGYGGWYVLEQDTALPGGLPPEGIGPVEDVGRFRVPGRSGHAPLVKGNGG
jgi:inosose dehydratase